MQSNATYSTPPSNPSPRLTVSGQAVIPGHLELLWPRQGQAEVDISDIGTLGQYGPADAPQPIASVAKTMTAYVILKDHPLAVGQQGPVIVVSAAEAGAYSAELAAGMSLVPVRAGERLTENQALEALMLPSANNIAHILARWDAGDDASFTAKMNEAANVLNMTHSNFTDPSGYSPTSVSTAADLVKLGESAMVDPYFVHLVSERTAEIPVAGGVVNFNTLLGTLGVTGIKTGSTNEAGGCILFSARVSISGRSATLVGAVLGQDAADGKELGLGLSVAEKLIRSAEQQLTTYTVAAAGVPVAVLAGEGDGADLSPSSDVTVIGWPGLALHMTLSGPANSPLLKVTSPAGNILATSTLAPPTG